MLPTMPILFLMVFVGWNVDAANKCVEDPVTPAAQEKLKQADSTNPILQPQVQPPPPLPSKLSMRKVSRPVTPNGQQRFDLSYAVFPGSDEASSGKPNNRPTIVFIGGGPGVPNIELGRDAKFPAGYDVIRLDQRGTGVNQKIQVKDFSKTFSSKQDADDVKAVIKAEGLNNYVVWGQSYGTVVATKLGADLGRSKDIPKPKSIVLEGVFGRALKVGTNGIHEFEETMRDSSSKVWRSLADTEREGLKRLYAELETRADGTAELFQKSMLNTVGLGQGVATRNLAGMSKMTASQLAEQLKEIEKMMAAHAPPPSAAMDPERLKFGRDQYRAVACNELQDTSKPSKPVPLFDGLFTTPSSVGASCGPCFVRSRSFYDSKAYQIQNIPVHYLQGDADWRTPPWQAQYHLENQTNRENSTFSLIANGSHIPSMQTKGPLDSPACISKLVVATFASQRNEFTDATTFCSRNASTQNHLQPQTKTAQ